MTKHNTQHPTANTSLLPPFPRQFDPRSPEMMDQAEPDQRLLALQLASLRRINRYFGGASAYDQAFRRLNPTAESATVLDLCTGSGDHLVHLLGKWPNLRVVAVDRQWATLATAKSHLAGLPADCVQSDARHLPFRDQSIDYVVCSLALHHFGEDDAVSLLREVRRVARKGGAVVDLRRGPLAFAAVWLLTALWLRDLYTRHDGRASVRAAFSRDELIHLANRAEWADYWYMNLPWFRQAIGFRHPQCLAGH